MKIIKKEKLTKKRHERNIWIERNILIQMKDNPWVVTIYHVFESKEKIYFVMEYCPGGELFNLLVKFGRF
jgi:serine/threonine protein kinase